MLPVIPNSGVGIALQVALTGSGTLSGTFAIRPAWPAALPQTLEVQGYSEQPPDVTLRTQMDAGPPKLRRRYTAGIRPIKGKMLLSPRTLVVTLDDFYNDSLLGGSLSFDWAHPRTGQTAVCRFASRPTYTPLGPEAWMVELDLEILSVS